MTVVMYHESTLVSGRAFNNLAELTKYSWYAAGGRAFPAFCSTRTFSFIY